MRAATQATAGGVGLAIVGVVAGLLATYFVPGVGCAAGPLLCVVALFALTRRRKVWLCDKCGGFFERA